jgi:hypothetical protein
MVKLKTLIKQKKSIRNGSTTKFKKQPREYDPREDLLDEQLIAKAI